MRVLFVPGPTKAPGHHRVPLAWALRAAGHEVCIAVRPNLVDDVTRTGLTAVPVGVAFDPDEYIETGERQKAESGPQGQPLDPAKLMRMDELRPEMLTYDYMQGLFTVMTTMVFRTFSPVRATGELVEFARSWGPDLVIWDPLVFAGPVAARACGAAHARLLYGLDLVGRMRESYLAAVARRPAELAEDPVAEWLGPVLAEYGCGFSEDVVTGQWTIDLVPSSMRLPADLHYVPVRHVPYNGRAVMPGWLREPPRRPRVCLSLGLPHPEVTGGNRVSVAELLAAVAGLDVEVVATLSAGQLASAGRVPPNVRMAGSVPLNELLPTCSAIVHEGDLWTLHTAFAHATPQVILPGLLWDIPLRAHQAQETGIGLCVGDVEGARAAELRGMVARVLADPSFAREAGRLRTEMLGTPAPSDIVPLLEKLTAEHRSPQRGSPSASEGSLAHLVRDGSR